MLRVGIEQPPDHALVLSVMFPRLALEELNASLAQGNGDLHSLVTKNEVLGSRQEVRNDLQTAEWFIRVSDFPVHKQSLGMDSDFVNTPPKKNCAYPATRAFLSTLSAALASSCSPTVFVANLWSASLLFVSCAGWRCSE